LVAPSHQPVEYLAKEDPHSLSDVRFSKETLNIEFRQVSDLGYIIGLPMAKYGLPRLRQIRQTKRWNCLCHEGASLLVPDVR